MGQAGEVHRLHLLQERLAHGGWQTHDPPGPEEDNGVEVLAMVHESTLFKWKTSLYTGSRTIKSNKMAASDC